MGELVNIQQQSRRKRKGTDDPVKWVERLNKARQRKQNTVEATWRVIRSQYTRTLINDDPTSEPKDIRVNLAFPTVKVLLRAAAGNDPYLYIRSDRPQDYMSAQILQYLENRLWRLQKRKRTMRRIVLDTILNKVGYGMTHLKKDPITGRVDIWLTRISPYQIWLEDVQDIEDSYYVIREIVMSKEEADKAYPNISFLPYDKAHERGEFTLSTQSASSPSADKMDRVVAYEVHDQYHGEISVITPTHNKYIIEPRPSPYPLPCLFTQLVFNEIPDDHYGISDLEPVAMQQEELDRVRQAMLIHTKRFNRKYKILDTEYEDTALDALESGEDGAMVRLKDLDSLEPIQDAPMSSDIYNYAAAIRADHREITGINEYFMAGQVGGTKTAFEAQQIMAGGRIRVGEKPEMVGDFCADVAYKDIMLMKTFYPVPQVVEFYGPEGEREWRYVQQWELQGEHYVTAHAGSTRPPDEQADFQKALVLYQTFKGDPTVNPQGLVEVVMDLMNLKEKNKLLGLAPTARSMSANPLQASGGPTMVPNGINPNSQELPDLAALRTALGNRGGPV